jgi:hypothetical protein
MRRIYSEPAYPGDIDNLASASVLAAPYDHDGPNILAEYDLSNNLSRRHVHGSTCVDERAILIEGPATAPSVFYVLDTLPPCD